ncbi:hypothetical protein [Cryptosporangium phraense]|uniref:Uncharacterized protein n=1 Tax=Cryptosporangium phraense TaxID=2593070 RepID=A0A545AND0_9ACTN|nr:hypothetical protein [Cryptosporangium phraense]TQS42783.1 hypothetical protein FL583_22225 [Cryptosporangium phraense]
MSIDLYFWKTALLADPDVVMDRLAMDDASVVLPDPAVATFRAQLLTRWPELDDQLSPADADLEAHFVIMQVTYSWDQDAIDEAVALSQRLGVCHYDPQTGDFLVPAGHQPATDHLAGSTALFPWADPEGSPDPELSGTGPLPAWPIWDVATSPRLRPARLTYDGELVTAHRGEQLITRRAAVIVTGAPGHLDPQRLTAALRNELAATHAQFLGIPLADSQRYYAEHLDGEADYPAYILVGGTASILFRHHAFTGHDVLVSTDPAYPVAVAYSRLDEYPDLAALDPTVWNRT